MEKTVKIKSILSQLDSCLDSLNYDLTRNVALYTEEDLNLLKYAIIDLSNGFRNLSNIINIE